MLVTFSTDAYADITMFGDVAIGMLKMMGLSGTLPSALLAEDIAVALKQLSTAINAEKTAYLVKQNDTNEQTVSLANRAIPLINLMTAAADAKNNVMWK